MRFLILNTDYPEFISWLYTQNPGLQRLSFVEQMEVRARSLFGVADFYSSNLRKLGHEAWDVYANNAFVQRAWAHEHGLRIGARPEALVEIRRILQPGSQIVGKNWLRRLRHYTLLLADLLDRGQSWQHDVLREQIRQYNPDVLLNQNIGIDGSLLRGVKSFVELLVGQHASPLPRNQNFGMYDLMISSLPNVVEYFRKQGQPSELHRFGFEPGVLGRLDGGGRPVPVSFVGSLFRFHSSRRRLLEHVCKRLSVQVWGHQESDPPDNSAILGQFRGPAWGVEMYRILRSSLVTLNSHIDMSQAYANNMRLFEATGVGTLLMTDSKKNLNDMFTPGEEVVAYESPEECVELIKYYLENEEERLAIARRGQLRTLREHTYYQRMQELVGLVQNRI